MWSPSRRKTNNCQHENVTQTSSYGLLRTVCQDCGNVSVEHISDFLEETLLVKEERESQV